MSPSIVPVKNGSQNHTVTAGKGSNMQNMQENQRICRTWRIFLKNVGQFNVSGLLNTHYKTKQKQQ